jgi:methanol corrinoid protein
MTQTKDIGSIFTRYDIKIEGARQEARQVSDDALLQQVANCVIEGDDEEI